MFDRKAYMKEYNKKYRAENKEKFSSYFVEYYKNNREKKLAAARCQSSAIADFLDSYKTELGCAVCGYNKNSHALVFHHRDPATKTRCVASCGCVSSAKEEADKCDVLCVRCHRAVHLNDTPRDSEVNWEERIRNNIIFMRRVKTLCGCSSCGYRELGVALDFHHVGDNKFKPVADLTHGPRDRLKEEIRKCVVMCANCHAIETHNKRKPTRSEHQV